MGKVKKDKRNGRPSPYSRPADVAMTFAPPIAVVEDVGDDDEINDADDGDNEDAGGDRAAAPVRTRAALLRRQKLELRDMRRGTVSDMIAQRSKLSRRVDKQLQGRKDLTRSMHSLVEETEQRHRQELADFEYASRCIRLSIAFLDQSFIVSSLGFLPNFSRFVRSAKQSSAAAIDSLPEIKFADSFQFQGVFSYKDRADRKDAPMKK
jgi:hypothetical protein